MRDEKIRHTLSERFADYGREPSEGVWDAIEMHLDEEDRNSGSSKSAFMWWSLAILGLTFASWGIFSNATTNDSVELAVAATLIEDKEKVKIALPGTPENSERTHAQIQQNNGVESKEQLKSTIENGSNEISFTKFPKENTELKESNQSKEPTASTTFKNEKRLSDISAMNNQNMEKTSVTTDIELLTSNEMWSMKSNQLNQAQSTESINDNPKIETTDPFIKIEKLDESALQLSTFTAREIAAEENTLGVSNQSHAPFNLLPPKWEMGIRLSTFKNIGSTSNPDSYLSPFTWHLINEPAPVAFAQNYKRYAEFQIDVSRRIGRKLHLSAGLSTSYSQNKGATLNEDSVFSLNHLSFGIPIEIGYTIVSYKRFSVKPYLGILNEFNAYLQKVTTGIPDPGTPSINPDENPETYKIFESGYSLGIQPSVEIYYYMNENTRLSLSCGYRKYIAGRTNGYSPGLNQPDYFQTAIGLSWILRKK